MADYNVTGKELTMEALAKEIRFAYKQNQAIYTQLSARIAELEKELAALKKNGVACAAPCESVAEEIAVADDNGDEMVTRYKKSFVAKMKQSDTKLKVYYSDIKNAFDSFKRINSTVSLQGDRFNFGRDTIAKMTVVGKTLKLYLALDVNDPELKETVYHQSDVSDQKAYESTPFLVKVKSEVGAKKAIRLVKYLAAKLEAVEDPTFEPVDYVAEYAYETDEELIKKGLIKVTQGKKISLNF
jgi:hypothetical protein